MEFLGGIFPRLRSAGFAVVAFVLTDAAVAELTWDRTRAEFAAAAGDPEVIALYRYKNTGTQPVSITSVRTSCQCTTAEPSISVIGPGQEGVLRTVFDVADRLGQQEKTITVSTDDPAGKPTELVLRVNIAEIVTAQPRAVVWHVGEALAEKNIVLEAVDNFRIRKIALPDDTGNFTCRVEPLPSGGFEFKITPKSTQAIANGIIRCTATVEGRPSLGVIVYALVR